MSKFTAACFTAAYNSDVSASAPCLSPPLSKFTLTTHRHPSQLSLLSSASSSALGGRRRSRSTSSCRNPSMRSFRVTISACSVSNARLVAGPSATTDVYCWSVSRSILLAGGGPVAVIEDAALDGVCAGRCAGDSVACAEVADMTGDGSCTIDGWFTLPVSLCPSSTLYCRTVDVAHGFTCGSNGSACSTNIPLRLGRLLPDTEACEGRLELLCTLDP